MGDWTQRGSDEVPNAPGLVEPAEPGRTCQYGTPEHGVPAEHVLIVGDKRIAYCKAHARHMLNMALQAGGRDMGVPVSRTSGGCGAALILALALGAAYLVVL